jgi:chromatin remodeling complex protein RSC6
MAPKTAPKKTDSTPAPAAAVAAPAIKEEVAAAEPKTKKTKTAAAPAAAVASAAAPAVKEEVVAAPADAAAAAENAEDAALADKAIEFLAKLNQIGTLISSLKSEYRTLEKSFFKKIKDAQKQGQKKRRKNVARAPSGFVKPTKISDELAAFLGKEKGSEMARTDVTRAINQYIRTNSLQDKDNGRKINPDAKLTALLKLKKTDELTYFNLQKYMGVHFAKATPAAAVATA